jgi:hypothetical protein
MSDFRSVVNISVEEAEVLAAAREHSASVVESQQLDAFYSELGQKVTAGHKRTSAAADRLRDALDKMRAAWPRS